MERKIGSIDFRAFAFENIDSIIRANQCWIRSGHRMPAARASLKPDLYFVLTKSSLIIYTTPACMFFNRRFFMIRNKDTMIHPLYIEDYYYTYFRRSAR